MLIAIARIFGGVAGVGVLLLAVKGAVFLSEAPPDLTTVTLLAILTSVAVTAVGAAILVQTLVLLALVYATRGERAIEWCSPSECLSFESWCAYSWSFYGAGGRHEGFRLFGLGIALQGDHGQAQDEVQA